MHMSYTGNPDAWKISYVDYRLAKISICTSSLSSPTSAAGFNSSLDWTSRNYREEAYGAVGTIEFNPPIEARHVAVISTLDGSPLALVEVKVLGMFVYVYFSKTKEAQHVAAIS